MGGVFASCAAGHPDCGDTQALPDLTNVFVIVVLGVGVVLIAAAWAWWRRGR